MSKRTTPLFIIVYSMISLLHKNGGKISLWYDVNMEASETDWGGYSGYFQDPDGYLWEVAWNPHFWIE
jgi:predicted lactoylglutathione lyase